MATSVGGVMVSIDAFQALDPGSIPGHRTLLVLFAVISSLMVDCIKLKISHQTWKQ